MQKYVYLYFASETCVHLKCSVPDNLSYCVKNNKKNLFVTSVSLHRPTLWRRAGRFYRLHRVTQLPRELSSQYWMHLDHQSTAQTQDPYCCPRNLPAYWGWVRRLLSHEEKLWVLTVCILSSQKYHQEANDYFRVKTCWGKGCTVAVRVKVMITFFLF